MWLQDRIINQEKGSEEWKRISTWLDTPPTDRAAARALPAPTGPVPVLPPSQHAASFAAFAAFSGT